MLGPCSVGASAPGAFFVKAGASGSACTQAAPCGSLQEAVDLAKDGDTVYVTGGSYRGGGAAVVSISKGITLAGGWDGEPSGDVVVDPTLYFTVIDGEGERRGIYVGGFGSSFPKPWVTLKGITVVSGSASGLGGAVSPAGADAGGGIYAIGANLVVDRCVVEGSRAGSTRDGAGGGLYAANTDLVVRDSAFRRNTASAAGRGYGGGIAVSGGTTVRLSRLQVEENVASATSQGIGGGVYLLGGAPELSDSVVRGNTGSAGEGEYGLAGKGGGITVDSAQGALLLRNTIQANVAAVLADGYGGGVYVIASDNVATSRNTINENVASERRKGLGGGLAVSYSTITLSGNTISDNAASNTGEGAGGALHAFRSEATLADEQYYGNEAASEPEAPGQGAALAVGGGLAVTATNCIFARNGLKGGSEGLSVGDADDSSASTLTLHFVTLADNGRAGLVARGDASTVTLANVIVAGHDVGLRVDVPSARVNADHTLWYPTRSFGGTTDGIVTFGDVVGDPRFVDRAGRDYHLGKGSAAIDAGAGLPGASRDFEGDHRPLGLGYDIGADEYRASSDTVGFPFRVFLPLASRD